MTLEDAGALLASVTGVDTFASIGPCNMMMEDEVELFRQCWNCPHNYSRPFIKGRVQSMVDGNFCCAGCVSEDLHFNAAKNKGFISLSVLKGYVESEVIDLLEGTRIVLQMMKKFSKEYLIEMDAPVRRKNGQEKCHKLLPHLCQRLFLDPVLVVKSLSHMQYWKNFL